MTGLTENRAVLETKSEFEETSLGKKIPNRLQQ